MKFFDIQKWKWHKWPWHKWHHRGLVGKVLTKCNPFIICLLYHVPFQVRSSVNLDHVRMTQGGSADRKPHFRGWKPTFTGQKSGLVAAKSPLSPCDFFRILCNFAAEKKFFHSTINPCPWRETNEFVENQFVAGIFTLLCPHLFCACHHEFLGVVNVLFAKT